MPGTPTASAYCRSICQTTFSELQPKLLRALQEKTFERLGGTKTIPIDVRLLAATNRNLTQMMADKLFRSDLYYRLRVFPITIPPLRIDSASPPPGATMRLQA